ncbi:transglycosylase domain-containing protein [Amycolatopsis sp. NPDC059021]|uniref:transglycosylase domain-containing protein n=1 Tax=Amycolatopsis sp. NPDC059021 TaxID=3346704 RepID=UPI00366C5FEA
MNDDRTHSWPGQEPEPWRRPTPGGPPQLGTPPGGMPPRRPGPPPPGYRPPQQQRPQGRPMSGPPAREPELMTHHVHNGTEPGEFEPRRRRMDAPPPESAPGGGGQGVALTPAQRKKRRWRRIRRTSYVLFGLFVVVPAIAFVITYFSVDVPSPTDVARSQSQAVTFLYADGTEMGKDSPSGTNRQILSPEQIPDVMKHAAIATEDSTFETNSGFDVTGIFRAVYNQVTGGDGGGSTISQQYIKKATDNDAPTLTRKWTELAKSFKMNQTFEKKDIITAYLNIIYFGRGAYGVGAASQAFFHKDAAQLNASEAALLAGLIQQPGRSENDKVAHDRWTTAMDRMLQNHYITQAERASAQFPTPIPLAQSKQQSGAPNRFIAQQVRDELAAQGITEDKYYSGGYKVQTTIDPKAQQAAEQAVKEGMQGQTDNRLLSALVAVDPKTGGVLAYYGGAETVKGPNGEEQAGPDRANQARNPGSSMKPFDLVAFLKMGKGLNETFDGSNNRVFDNRTIRNAGPGSTCGPQCTVAKAMEISANTVFYDMVMNKTHPGPVGTAAQEAGIKTKNEGGQSTIFTGDNNIALGGGKTEVSPADMASAYATFAAGGVQRDRHFVVKVVNSQNETAYEAKTTGKSAFANDSDKSKQIAGNVTTSLKPVISFSKLNCPSGHECAGKTGTQQYAPQSGDPASAADSNAQTWMVGYTPSVSAAVWVGGDGNIPLHDKKNQPIFGSTIAAPTWAKFMQLYLNGKPAERFDTVKPIGDTPSPSQSPSRNPDDDNDTTPTTTPTKPSEETTTPTRPSRPSHSKPHRPSTSTIELPGDGDDT